MAVLVPAIVSAQRLVPAALDIGGTTGWVHDLLEYEGQLIIAGQFSMANGQPVTRICAWDGGTSIDPMGFLLDYPDVKDIVEFDGKVIFGGSVNFQNKRIFQWDGDSAVAFGTYTAGEIEAMVVFEGGLVVGGSFDTMDGETVHGIARWDGTQWASFGPGFNGAVYALAVHEGLLYIGGAFTGTASGDIDLHRLAVWNGSGYGEAGGGLDGPVLQLLPRSDGLWISGSFHGSMDGSQNLDRFARWSGQAFDDPIDHGQPVGSEYVNGLVDLGSYGLLAHVSEGRDRLLQNGAWKDAYLRDVRTSIEFQGVRYVGGDMPHPEVELGRMAFMRLMEGSGKRTFNAGGFNTMVQPYGSQFYDRELGIPYFAPLTDPLCNSIGFHGHYIVAYANDSAYTSCFQPFRWEENHTPGPRSIARDIQYHERYDRTWSVDVGQLWEHAATWDDPGYTPPVDLTDWPCRGVAANGEPTTLASFQDGDLDGQYEPDLGDLPSIKGDAAVLILQTDQASEGHSYVYPAGFDSRMMFYGYTQGEEDVLDQTLFGTYWMTNRSGRTYDSVVVALYSQPKVGCGRDDGIGCDPELGMMYAYNLDDQDSDGEYEKGFGAHPPAQGMVGLNADLRSFIPQSRYMPCNDEPVFTNHAVRMAEGLCLDGSPLYDPNTHEPTTHYFSDYPDVVGGFHQVGFPFTSPDTMSLHGIASFGPFFDVAPGETICFDMAFVYARDTTQDNIQNTRVLQQKVIALKEWYAQQPYGCDEYATLGMPALLESGEGLRLFPNPASDNVRLERADILKELSVSLLTASGQLLEQRQWPAGSASLTVDVQLLPNGVYVLQAAGRLSQQSERLVILR